MVYDDPVQLRFIFGVNDMIARDQHYDEVTYDSDGSPLKTLDEYERHYYITGQTELHSLWSMLSDIEDALAVSARMQ